MSVLRYIFIVLMLSVLCSACSVARRIPEGSYLLQRVDIVDDKSTPKKERITSADLERFVRQSPNKRFLGANIYVWLYELANPAKHNKWNNFKRRIGQAPILLDESLIDKTVQNFKVYMDSKGFFASSAKFEIDTTSRKKRAVVTYTTTQRQPYRIDSISYDFKDKFIEPIVLKDTINTLLHKGEIFDITVLDKERERITADLKRNGYYNFSVNNIEYLADTLGRDDRVDITVVVKQYLSGYNQKESLFWRITPFFVSIE